MKENYKIKNCQGGFTIIETMIATSLFLVIIMTGIVSLLNANLVHQKSQDMRGEMDNLSFVLEDISRNLRTGSKYYCIIGADSLSNVNTTKSSPNGQNCWGLAFESSSGDKNNPNDQWVYYIDNNGAIWKSTQGPYTDPTNFIQLTPSMVKIDSISGFSVLGAEPPSGDQQQPFVTIRLVGSITSKNAVTSFSLETSVSQRLVDI
jgi:type II secretory pathway pseudopilin PulG